MSDKDSIVVETLEEDQLTLTAIHAYMKSIAQDSRSTTRKIEGWEKTFKSKRLLETSETEHEPEVRYLNNPSKKSRSSRSKTNDPSKIKSSSKVSEPKTEAHSSRAPSVKKPIKTKVFKAPPVVIEEESSSSEDDEEADSEAHIQGFGGADERELYEEDNFDDIEQYDVDDFDEPDAPASWSLHMIVRILNLKFL
jgi:hypothetical protein